MKHDPDEVLPAFRDLSSSGGKRRDRGARAKSACRALIIGAALVLGGCSLAESILPDPEPSLADLDAATQIWKIYPSFQLPGNPEVSQVHRNPSSFLAEWAVCLRNDVPDKRKYYALFFRNRKITDYRLSVITDGCESEVYARLPPVAVKDPEPLH